MPTFIARGLLLVCGFLSASLSPACAQSPPAAAPENWAASVKLPAGETPITLFNGKDLAGWEGRDDIWKVEDGAIVGHNTAALAASTYLFTKDNFRNFRLLLEVKQTKGEGFSPQHSAVAILGEKFTDRGDTFSFKGPLAMFCKDWGFYEVNGRNRLAPPRQRGQFRHPAEKDGEWNQVEILVVGERIRQAANGQLVADYTDEGGHFKESPLGLQIHSDRLPQKYLFRGLIVVRDPTDQLATVVEQPAGN